MKLYIDNATNSLVTSATITTTPTITLFKEDISSVEIRFVENGLGVDIGTPTIRLALGKDGVLIGLTDSWTKNGTGATAYWTGNFNLNTEQAEMVLAGLSSTEAILEVEVRVGTLVATKAQLSVTLKTDLINETDSATEIGNIVTIGETHIASTTAVHGIANTADLATKAYADGAGLKAGVQWTDRHIASTGNPYLIGSIVYNAGRVYRCIAENDSILPAIGGNDYWADLGVGYLLPNETLTPSDIGASATGHTHTKSEITDFTHTHAISDVTNLQTKLNTKQELYYSEVTVTAGGSYSMPPNSTISDSTGSIERRILFIFSGVHTSATFFSFPATGNAGDMVTVTNSLQKADQSLNTMQLVVREVDGTITNVFDNIAAGQSHSYVRKTSETGTGKWTSVPTPAHAHGNINGKGAVGTTANLPLITTTSGVVTTGTFGTTANSFCQGNDVRLGAKTVFTLGGDEKITYALGGSYVYGGQITRGSKVSGGLDQTGLHIQGNWTIKGLIIMANYPSAGTAGVTYGLVKINNASTVTNLWTAPSSSGLNNGLNTINNTLDVSLSDGDKIGFQLTIGSTAGATVPTNANSVTITAYVYCVPR